MSKKPNYATRGGQITFHNLRMFFQIQGWLIKWGFILWAVFALIVAYFMTPKDVVFNTFYYLKFQGMSLLQHAPTQTSTMQYHGQIYENTIDNFIHDTQLLSDAKLFWFNLEVSILIGFSAVGAVVWAIMRYFNNAGKKQTEDKFIRGMTIAEPKELAKKLRRNRKQSDFKFDGMRIFKKNFEVQHMLLDGTTGSGKSVALRKMLHWIRERGDKAIIYDKGCSFTGKFYNPKTDVILNPFDERSAYWDVWCDANTPSDFENEAAALIPQQGEGDPFWVLAARAIFSSTAYKMFKEEPIETRTTDRFLELMLTSDLDDLSQYLKGTESSALVDDKAAKIAISIKSILAAYIKSLRFLEGLENKTKNGQHRPRFSIRDWVKNDKEKGFLFLSSNAQQHASLRPLISMWLSTASTAILGSGEDENRRIWVIMDEMPTLHKLPELAETIAEVRRFGGCYVIGIQSYAQLKKNYGQNAADEMFDLLNTRLFYRAPSEAMARISSKELGEQEIEKSKEQYSYGAATVRDGVSLGYQTVTRPAVTPSEIMQLEDLQCWLKTSGNYPITKLNMRYDKLPNINSPFIARDMPSSTQGTRLDEIIVANQLLFLHLLPEDERGQVVKATQHTMEEDTPEVLKQKLEAQTKLADNVKRKMAIHKEKQSIPSTDAEKASKEKESRETERLNEEMHQFEADIVPEQSPEL